jgi:hypothetical protein
MYGKISGMGIAGFLPVTGFNSLGAVVLGTAVIFAMSALWSIVPHRSKT